MLIRDITPVEKQSFDTVEPTPRVSSQRLMQALYKRGVTIRDIFGFYYELEEIGNHRSMTVEDARLAGYPDEPLDERPF